MEVKGLSEYTKKSSVKKLLMRKFSKKTLKCTVSLQGNYNES